MKRFRFSLLVALGLLIFTTTQFASSPTSVQQGETAKTPANWGSGPAGGIPGVNAPQVVAGPCGATTLRFNEVPFQPVNGLDVRGAQFSFFIGGGPSTDANYNSFGPGTGIFVQDPTLEGNALGTLVIDFPTLTPYLSFGLARSIVGPLTPGATVLLFDMNGNLIGSFPLNTAVQPGGTFSEGEFAYNNPATPVRRAILLFPSANLASRFALDNLNYRAYDISLEDVTTHDIFQFNSITGDYEFVHCADGSMVFGRGGAVRFGCSLSFGAGGGNKGGAAQVQASLNTCSNVGSATIKILPSGMTFTVFDSNTMNNTCTCGAD